MRNEHSVRCSPRARRRLAEEGEGEESKVRGTFDRPNVAGRPLAAVASEGRRGQTIPGPIATFDARWPLELSSWPGLEAQIAALADDIAYINHDIDDGLRAGIFHVADLVEAPLAGPHVRAVTARYGQLEPGRFIGELIRTLMSALVDDVRAETEALSVRRCADIGRGCAAAGRALVAFSDPMMGEVRAR